MTETRFRKRRTSLRWRCAARWRSRHRPAKRPGEPAGAVSQPGRCRRLVRRPRQPRQGPCARGDRRRHRHRATARALASRTPTAAAGTGTATATAACSTSATATRTSSPRCRTRPRPPRRRQPPPDQRPPRAPRRAALGEHRRHLLPFAVFTPSGPSRSTWRCAWLAPTPDAPGSSRRPAPTTASAGSRSPPATHAGSTRSDRFPRGSHTSPTTTRTRSGVRSGRTPPQSSSSRSRPRSASRRRRRDTSRPWPMPPARPGRC